VTPTLRHPSLRRPAQAGFTLVELLVALILALLLSVAMLKMQGSLAQQTVRNVDAGVRDEQWRTAVDTMTRVVSSSGFVLGGTQKPCNEMFTYNSAAGPANKYFTHHAVDSAVAANGLRLAYASGLTLNYPAAGSPIPSDVLAVTTSNDASSFNNAVSPAVAVFSNSLYTPSSTGVLPVQTTTGVTVNDAAVLQVGLTNRIACIRLKMTAVGLPAGTVTAGGTFSPATFFNGFAPSLAAAGYPALTDASIFQGQLVDLTPTPTAVTQVFYIDGTTYAFPVLMSAQYGFGDDALVANSAQIVAAGAISLQVRYGVDPGKTGAVTAYESAATVTANNHWDVVRTVNMLLVTRSLADDPAYTAPATVPLPTLPFASSDQFRAVPVPATLPNRHYVVNQFEVAERNVLWNCAFSTVCVP